MSWSAYLRNSLRCLRNSQRCVLIFAFGFNIYQKVVYVIIIRYCFYHVMVSINCRSSRPKVFCGLLQAEACNFIKKETLAQVFSCEFCEISKNTLSYRTPPVAASVTALKLLKVERNT